MVFYDTNQIEANLKLVGFENIKYEEKNSSGLLLGTLTATKPVNKEKDIQYEIIKSEKQYSYRNKSDKNEEGNKNINNSVIAQKKQILTLLNIF